MLNEEQLQAEVKITGGVAFIMLQCVSRLAEKGALKDVELAPVGGARQALVQALEAATEVNYDVARAKAQAELQQRMAAARAAQAAQQAEAEESGDGGEGLDATAEAEPGDAGVVEGANGADELPDPATQATG